MILSAASQRHDARLLRWLAALALLAAMAALLAVGAVGAGTLPGPVGCAGARVAVMAAAAAPDARTPAAHRSVRDDASVGAADMEVPPDPALPCAGENAAAARPPVAAAYADAPEAGLPLPVPGSPHRPPRAA